MAYYLRAVPGQGWQVWKISQTEARRIGIVDVENVVGAFFKAELGESIWDKLRRDASGFFSPTGENPFKKIDLCPGQFYPRIARPWDWRPFDALSWNKSALDEPIIVTISLGQLEVLTRQLQRICQTVHPEGGGLDAYGHDIRNLIILACTEVEAQWRGVLVANGVKVKHLNTNSYVKLSNALKLRDYAVEFPYFPWLPPFRPFIKWGITEKPSRDLTWYSAYNAVKHDRETSFSLGTLRHAFEAIAADAIMIAAQFGIGAAGFGKSAELYRFFKFTARPSWDVADLYIRAYDGENEGWSKIMYRFQ